MEMMRINHTNIAKRKKTGAWPVLFFLFFLCASLTLFSCHGKKDTNKDQQTAFSILEKDSFTVVYRQHVNGYEVKAVVKPESSSILTADFTFAKEGKSFSLYTTSFGDTIYNLGNWGLLGENDTILLKYRHQTIYADYHENSTEGETMLGWTPFFFKDLDFDGIEELVIVHYSCAVRYHSGYDVYRIVEGKPYKIDYPPYNSGKYENFGMTDYLEFDFKKKIISCPYPEGELTYIGQIYYGVSQKQKDTIIVEGRVHYFNHIEKIREELFM